MIDGILAVVAEPQTRSLISIGIGGLIIFLVYGGILVLIIIGLLRLVRFLGTANKEMKLTRMEVGKLAEEVHLLRQELKGGKNSNSSEP